MIEIPQSNTADTRTCDFANVSRETPMPDAPLLSMDPEFERLVEELRDAVEWHFDTVGRPDRVRNRSRAAIDDATIALWRWHCEQVERAE